MLNIVAAFIGLTTLLTYVNYRFIRLPPTIGVMVTALIFSALLQLISMAGFPLLEREAQEMISGIDFSEILMTWFLPALLFAGALHIDLNDLRSYKWPISLLATIGVLIATFVIGGLAFLVFDLFGWHIPFIYCLLFGALISPTDPIAVMGILKSAGAPKPLAMTIVGESLFNDGTAVVVFSILLAILLSGTTPGVAEISWLFAKEAVGGVLFGAAIGAAVLFMMRGIDQYQVEVMLTICLVFGGAAFAKALHVSGPLAMVVAGLIIGNHGRHQAMSEETRRYIDKFWELVDEILNMLLFALIGLELLLLPFNWLYAVAALLLGVIALLARLVTVAPPIILLRSFGHQAPLGTIRILAWGGLRGGVSVALALALPNGAERDLLLTLTYILVLVSILSQGLSIGSMVAWIYRKHPKSEEGLGEPAESAH